MKIALIGREKSGKTTVFNALTGLSAATDLYCMRRSEPRTASVRVVDPRIERLAEIYHPRRVTHATLECMDFCGIREDSTEGKGVFSPSELNLLRTADAFAVVLRNFHDTSIDASAGPCDPETDYTAVRTELALDDYILVQTRLERIEEKTRKNLRNQALLVERDALAKISPFLDDPDATPIPTLMQEEEKAIRGLRLLSLKPLLIVLNSDENTFGSDPGLLERLERSSRVVEFAGKFEMDLTRLEPEEARAFMDDMGIVSSARERLTRAAYDLLGYISFFTVGEDEVRAWTIRQGTTAQEAAGVIHSDLARGFIRAECFSCRDLLAYGSEKTLKDRGLVRTEGKAYVVKDGDVLSIRFNV